MYKIQEKTHKSVRTLGGGQLKPLVTLKDEYGGISHIAKDDHCYVLINKNQKTGHYVIVNHWLEEAALALAELVGKGKENEQSEI